MTFTEDKTCCFTGHRNIPEYMHGTIRKEIEKIVSKLYLTGIDTYICGGALGFDTIAAEAIIEVKNTYPDIRLHLAIPCPNHDKSWSVRDRRKFSVLLAHADSVCYVSPDYTRFCMFTRNRYMVDNSAYCISYCTEKTGGTYYTVGYAAKKGKIIIELSDILKLNC